MNGNDQTKITLEVGKDPFTIANFPKEEKVLNERERRRLGLPPKDVKPEEPKKENP